MSELERLLREVAEADRSAEPSADARDRLAGAVRANRRAKAWPWALAAAAVLAIGLFVPEPRTAPPDAVADGASEAAPIAAEVSASEFLVLDPVLPIEGMRSGRLVRVTLPADAPSYFGLPLRSRSGPVEADVLLGDDGIARAVRFVR